MGAREGKTGGVGGQGDQGMGTEVLPCPPPRRGMLPWPSRWGAGEEQEPEEQGSLAGSDPSEAWTSGEEALGKPGASPQDSPQPQSPRPSWTRKEHLLTPPPSGLAAEQSLGTSGGLGGGPLKDDFAGTMGPQL